MIANPPQQVESKLPLWQKTYCIESWRIKNPHILLRRIANPPQQDAGYTVIATFTLPSHCWIDNYYSPQRIIQQNFLKRHSDNPAAADRVENQRREAELYLRYQHYYGYVFYIGRKC